jgi:hypothetical protein
MSPCVAEAIARGGYTKEKMKQYLYEHARFTARRFKQLPVKDSLAEIAAEGRLPAIYGESDDLDHLLPIVWSPEDFMITVSGDPGRDNCFICGQNGFIGYPVSHKIELPANWEALLQEAGRRKA